MVATTSPYMVTGFPSPMTGTSPQPAMWMKQVGTQQSNSQSMPAVVYNASQHRVKVPGLGYYMVAFQ